VRPFGAGQARTREIRFLTGGIAKHVFFTYPVKPESDVGTLWTNYMDHITGSDSLSIWVISFSDFDSKVKQLDINDTMPYLIRQLDDVRPIPWNIIVGGGDCGRCRHIFFLVVPSGCAFWEESISGDQFR
jgi:hypothetical protein